MTCNGIHLRRLDFLGDRREWQMNITNSRYPNKPCPPGPAFPRFHFLKMLHRFRDCICNANRHSTNIIRTKLLFEILFLITARNRLIFHREFWSASNYRCLNTYSLFRACSEFRRNFLEPPQGFRSRTMLSGLRASSNVKKYRPVYVLSERLFPTSFPQIYRRLSLFSYV